MARGTVLVALAAGLIALPAQVSARATEPVGTSAAEPAGRATFKVFKDEKGDSKGAPDIASVQVGNEGSLVWFVIRIANQDHPAEDRNHIVEHDIDLDIDPKIGTPRVDRVIRWQHGKQAGSADAFGMERYNPADGKLHLVRPNPKGLGFAEDTGLIYVSLPISELGERDAFRFYVVTQQREAGGTFDVLARDTAPEDPNWFTYKLAPLGLKAGAAKRKPQRPVAGRPFTVTWPLTRTDSGFPPQQGKVACEARAGTLRVPARGTFVRADGAARCSLRVPKAAAKKRLVLKMTYRLEGETLVRSISSTVG